MRGQHGLLAAASHSLIIDGKVLASVGYRLLAFQVFFINTSPSCFCGVNFSFLLLTMARFYRTAVFVVVLEVLHLAVGYDMLTGARCQARCLTLFLNVRGENVKPSEPTVSKNNLFFYTGDVQNIDLD